MATDSEDDRTGYGRPPKHSQFKKGRSGNPRGRPKGASSFKADLTAELQAKLALTENGKEHRVTTQKAVIRSLTAAALKNDMRAVNTLFSLMKFFGVGREEQTSDTMDFDDLDLLEDYLIQERKKRSGGSLDRASGSVKQAGSGRKKKQ